MNSSTPPSSSPKPVVVDITLPTAWDELDEPLLIYILRLMAAGFSFEDIRSYIVLRKIPRHVVHHIPTEQMAVAAFYLRFLETPPDRPLRPAHLAKGVAIDAELHGLPFRDYLIIENLWQGFMDEQTAAVEEVAHSGGDSEGASLDTPALRALLPILYPAYREKRFEPWHALAVIYWMQGLKALYSQVFPHLFRTAAGSATGEAPDMRMVMETQIRALTDGDITKREAVLSTETWAALTELDAKAREAEEMKSMKK